VINTYALPVAATVAHVDITGTRPPIVGHHVIHRGAGNREVFISGAVELQRGIVESEPEGWCSVFIVFSEPVTSKVIALKLVDLSKPPKRQACTSLRVASWEELLAVLQLHLCQELCNGSDYKVFAVPAAIAACYVITPGCLHAFYRHPSFRGIVDRVWWETCTPAAPAPCGGAAAGSG
jgi:hypothetical protein